MDLMLAGKRVLITGASKGIGAEAARVFAEEGCNLLLAARSIDALTALASRLRADYAVKVDVSQTDLRDSADLSELAAQAADVDILVNNAGDLPGGNLELIDERLAAQLGPEGLWLHQPDAPGLRAHEGPR